MLVFDEEKYAKSIINNKRYETLKNQGQERCIIVRYLTYIGCDELSIKKILFKIPMLGGDYLSDRDKDIIYSKIISKANNYNLISGIKVNIYKPELDIILGLEDQYARRLLFIYLVYYKWACNINHLQFFSKKNNISMVVENNKELWKLAGLSKLRVNDRYKICNQLFNDNLYRVDNFKSHNYFYLPFSVEKGDIAMTIDNYDNILGELYLYENPNEYKRCSICGMVIKKTRSPKKYCLNCAKKENIRKTKERKKSLKTKTVQALV